MTKEREALKLALEGLEAHADIGIKADKAITAIKEALAQPERKYTTTRNAWTGKATHKCNVCGRDDFRTEHAAKFHTCAVLAQPEQEPVKYDCCGNCMRPQHEHNGNSCPKPYTTVWHAWDYDFSPYPAPAVNPSQQAIHCKHRRENSGVCPHHNLQCGWPKCNAPEQEPVATDWERIARVQDAKLRAMCNEAGGFEKLCEVMDKYERITPPQRKPLTDEEIEATFTKCGGKWNGDQWVIEDADLHPFVRTIEHPELNTLQAISDEYNAWIKHHAAGHTYDDFLVKRLAAHGIKGEA